MEPPSVLKLLRCTGTLLFLASVTPIFSYAQQALGPANEALVSALGDILRWEILWEDTPSGFFLPPTGSATVSILKQQNEVAYCSKELGVCALYLADQYRNWQRLRAEKIRQPGNTEALWDFMGMPRPGKVAEYGGLPGKASGPLQFTSSLSLSDRSEIIKEYQGLRSADWSALEDWLRRDLQDSGYSSIYFACFKPSDPVVFVYGERGTKEPIVFSLFWSNISGDWMEAGSLLRSQGIQRFERLKTTIQSIACGHITMPGRK